MNTPQNDSPKSETPAARHTDGGFSIKYYCTSWGMVSNGDWDAFCQRVKQAGYDGVETALPSSTEEREHMTAALRTHGLALGILCGYWGDPTFGPHTQGYKAVLEAALPFKPDYINSQTGKDYYSFEQNKALIDLAETLSQASGIPIYHETHRSRFNFAAHITKAFLEKIGHLSLTLDISHWCCVHETMLRDQPEAVALALSRTAHVHARVGHPHGPQINDPAAPEWQAILEQHLRWWDEVVAQHRAQGKTLGITAEFGPPDYMPTLPYTRQPLADQWQANTFILNQLKSRYTPPAK